MNNTENPQDGSKTLPEKENESVFGDIQNSEIIKPEDIDPSIQPVEAIEITDFDVNCDLYAAPEHLEKLLSEINCTYEGSGYYESEEKDENDFGDPPGDMDEWKDLEKLK